MMLIYCRTIRLIYLSLIVASVDSTIVRMREYKAFSTMYGEPLHVTTTPSLLECARTCYHNNTCRSAIFEEVSSTCTTSKLVANDSIVCGTLLECSDPSAPTYLEKEPKTTMLQSCLYDPECVDQRSICVFGQCQCGPGYHYNANTYACVTSCSSYGTRFQVDIDHRIHSHNMETIENVTLDDCRTRCLAETSYVCKTFVYGIASDSALKCRLQNVTAFDVPTDFEPHVGLDVYKRDCAVLP